MTAVETQLGLEFQVRHETGRSERLIVDAERALVGSAAHCEVRLPPEFASPEHVEVFVGDRCVHLSARNAERPPLLDGVPFTAGLWPAGSVLTVGAIGLRVRTVELGVRRAGRSPFWLLAPVPIVALVATVLYARAVGPAELPIPEAPPLFDVPVKVCPIAIQDQTQSFAAEKLRLALAKRERSPFSPRDAVDAVPLFELAASCFRVAESVDDERFAASAAARLRDRLNDEYKVRRVRLEHAFRTGDPISAKHELDVLVPMTSHRTGPYVEWLASLDRYATLEIELRTTRGLGQ